ncbi:hypothetical protein FRC02_008777 [Tulasnella sp. 418]|nr:hypothetical protein FRC02_008777 [Tulasnella sp. 418]
MTDASQHGHELTPLRAPEYSQFVHASRDSSPPVPLPTGEVSLMGQALLRHPPLSDPTRFSSVEVPLASLISRPQLSREGTALSNHLPLGNPTRFSSVEVPLARLMSRSQVPREGTPLSNHLPLSDPTRFSSVEVPLSRFQPRGKSIPEIKAGLPVTRRYLNLNRVKRKATVEQPDSSDEEPLARKSRRKNQSKTSDDIRVPSRSKRNKKRRQTSVQLDSNMETSPQPQYADDLQQSVPEDENLPNVIPRSDTPSLSEDDPRDWEIEIPSGQITRSLDESNVDSFGIQETEVSVSRFLTLYKRMATGAEPHPMQHRFALTGLSPRGNKRAVITCKAGLDEATLPMLEAHADIDSVKGVLFSGDQWPFKSPVYLTPIPLLSETINGQSRFYIQKDGKDVPIHHFKNCGFAKCGGDIRIRVIFPLMQDHTPGRKNAVMTQADLKKWYFFIQEAMRKVKKVDLRHWPESYEHGLETSRLSNGTLCIAPIEVHKDIIGSLITTIREVVDADYEYQLKFSGFLLYWEIQNKKGGSRAKIRVDGSDYLQILKEKIIPTAFSDVDVDCLVFRNVQADPAIEYSTEEWSLYWRREFHQLLLSHSTGVSLDVAGERVSAFSSGAQYQCDLLCLMRDIAGMHFNTRGNATDNRVYYMQAYHTDKEVTYQSKAWNKQIPFKPSEVINPPKDATTGITGYTSRIKKYLDLHGRKLSSAARLEVTISMDELESFHLPLTRDLLLQAFERIHRRVMPLFRIMKLDAIQYYYSRMHQAHAETLITTQCAGLLAAFAWMLPALHGRPDESPAHRRIAACAAVPTGVLPNSDIRPLFAKGQFLLTEVQLVEEVPRLVRSPAAEDVLAVLGIQDQEKLLGQLRTGTHRAQPNARYGATKNKQVAVFCAGMHSPVEDIKRMVAPWLEGRGLEYLSSNNDLHYTPEYITTNPLPDNTKSDIYIEYLFQCCCRSVLQKPPNRKANPSKGIIRSTYFRGGTQADVDAILSYDHNYWRIPVNGILQDWPEHYRMHGHHPVAGGQGGRTWWDYSFDKFFPKKGAPPEPPSLQGLHQLECRDRWIDLMDAAETHEAELIRTLMKAKFDTLSAFLPAKDKLWNCDEWTTATASKRSGKTKRGVHLVINSHPRDMSFSSGYRT